VHHLLFELGGFDHVGRIRHRNRLGRRTRRSSHRDLLGRGFQTALGQLGCIRFAAQLDVLADHRVRAGGAQFFHLAPGDGHFAQHVALEPHVAAVGVQKVPDQFLVVVQDQHVGRRLGRRRLRPQAGARHGKPCRQAQAGHY